MADTAGNSVHIPGSFPTIYEKTPSRVSVLYVDDEISLHAPFKIYLEQQGDFIVDTSSSADDAIKKIQARHYDIIISDYLMPGIHGILFLKMLRQNGNEIPFILFTGKGDEDVVIEAYASGADFYLVKGSGNLHSTYLDLKKKILQIVNRRRVEGALKDREELFRTLFNNANDSIFVTETRSEGSFNRFIMVNDIACKRLGYAREELLTLSLNDIITSDDSERIPSIFLTLQKRGHATFDNFYRKKDGSQYPVEVSAHLFEMNDKKLVLSIARDITERKNMETALRASEQRLHAILDGSSIPQFVINNDHEVIYWNRALESYSGITSREIRYTKNAWKAFYSSPRPVLADLLIDENLDEIAVWYGEKVRPSRYIEGAFELTDFFPHFGKEGTWLHGTAVAIRDATGSIVGALETLEDITDRKNAEQELVSSKTYLKTIFDSVQTGLLITDPGTGIVVDANPAASTMIGKDISEIIGSLSASNLCHGDIKGAGSEKSDTFTECIIEHPSERKIPILKKAVPVVISGKPLLLESFLDITDRKRAEDAMQIAYADLEMKVHERTRELIELNQNLIREAGERKRLMDELKISEEKYRSLVEQTNDIVFQIDPSGHITYTSPNIVSIMGYSVEECLGASPAEFMPKNSASQFRSLYDQNIQMKQPVSGLELTLLDRRQVPHVFEINGSPHINSEGIFLGFSGIARDITDRKALQDRVAASLKEKEILLKEIHHRVKNNMQVISSLLNLQAKLIKDTASREVIRESQNRVMSIALVHEKLYQSKNLAEIDYEEYLKKITEYLLQAYGVPQKRIRIEIHAENMVLPVDKAIPLSLIVNEMISNSLKYAFPGGRAGTVCIDFTKSDSQYILSVADDGIGLPETVTLDGTETLGLQLIMSLVRQIQGIIMLKRDVGTSYTISFTLEPHYGE